MVPAPLRLPSPPLLLSQSQLVRGRNRTFPIRRFSFSSDGPHAVAAYFDSGALRIQDFATTADTSSQMPATEGVPMQLHGHLGWSDSEPCSFARRGRTIVASPSTLVALLSGAL